METASLTCVLTNNAQNTATVFLYRPVMDKIPCPHMPWIRYFLRMSARKVAPNAVFFLEGAQPVPRPYLNQRVRNR